MSMLIGSRLRCFAKGTWYLLFTLLFLTFSLLFPTFLWAQEGGRFVQDVRVEGLTRVPASTILSNIKTKRGLIINRETINQDIRRIFQLGQFQDVQVDEVSGPHGLVITFIVSEKVIISAIAIEGNKKIKDSAIREVITLPLHQPLNEKKLAESLEALRGIIRTRKKGPFAFVTGTGKYKEEELKQDTLRLTFHYLKHGYLKVEVDPPQISLTKDRRYFFVTFHVREGDRYRIGKVTMEGDILTTKEELVADLLTKTGQIYNREFIEKDLQALTKKYANQGYAFVNIQPVTPTDEVNKTADINFQVFKGNRIVIERIDISGNTTTRDKVIRRELQVKEGDIYNETKIEESRNRLMALGFFKEVNFATPRGSRDDTLKLNITVEERPTGSFSVGAGFSTAENFILSGSIQKQNFFGKGWNGEVSAEFSSRRQQFLFSLTDPYFFDTEWILGISAYRTIFRFTDFDRESFGGGLSIGHRFFDYASVSLGYEAEQVDAVDFADGTPVRFTQNASGLTSLLNLTLNRDTRDNRIYANKGMLNSVKLEISGDKLGGDNDFFRVTGRTQYYKPIWKGFAFKTYARAGYIKSLNNDVIQ